VFKNFVYFWADLFNRFEVPVIWERAGLWIRDLASLYCLLECCGRQSMLFLALFSSKNEDFDLPRLSS